MSSVYKKKKLKDVDGTYLLTPSSLDLVFDDEGGKLIDKLNSVNEKLTQKANLSDIRDMATQSYVNDKIAEASLSGGVDLSNYQTKEDSTLATSSKTVVGAINEVNQEVVKKAPLTHSHQATQVTFTDGQTFQQKLDNGSLKGDKGDKGDKGEDYTEVLVTNIASGGRLTLTSDKFQYASVSNGDTIVLPNVSKFTQIHLFFNTGGQLTLTFPSVKWQKIPDIQPLKTYEFIFTYVNETWLGGWIVYE